MTKYLIRIFLVFLCVPLPLYATDTLNCDAGKYSVDIPVGSDDKNNDIVANLYITEGGHSIMEFEMDNLKLAKIDWREKYIHITANDKNGNLVEVFSKGNTGYLSLDKSKKYPMSCDWFR